MSVKRFFKLAIATVAALAALGCSDSNDDPMVTPEPEPEGCWTAAEGELGFGTRNDAAWVEMAAVAGSAEDGPFYMLNLIKFRELACYPDGRETTLTGEEADALYAPIEFLAAIGAQPVFVGPVETTLLGDGVKWDQVAIVLYPSRAGFLEMVNNEEFQARSIHKQAGVERSTVMMAQMLDSQLPPDFVPPESPYPATADDPPVEVVHVLKFHEQAQYAPGEGDPSLSGEEAVALYSEAASQVALPLGVYPLAWFDVQEVMLGDGRTWDQLRINHMPSHAAFDALVNDPDRQAAQFHREAGLEDTYTVLTQPQLNSLDPF